MKGPLAVTVRAGFNGLQSANRLSVGGHRVMDIKAFGECYSRAIKGTKRRGCAPTGASFRKRRVSAAWSPRHRRATALSCGARGSGRLGAGFGPVNPEASDDCGILLCANASPLRRKVLDSLDSARHSGSRLRSLAALVRFERRVGRARPGSRPSLRSGRCVLHASAGCPHASKRATAYERESLSLVHERNLMPRD